MDFSTLSGLTASFIGILLFLMGFYKGKSKGIENAIQSMFTIGVLAVDADDNIIAGPEIKKAHK
jgi:hypothetical protein|tara:strand:- start:5050 stop:5241 length:192 start_codon:yes stop_codon:yes gene_type:complete